MRGCGLDFRGFPGAVKRFEVQGVKLGQGIVEFRAGLYARIFGPSSWQRASPAPLMGPRRAC